jgi:hypothetical protein
MKFHDFMRHWFHQDPHKKLVTEINNIKDLNSKFVTLFIKSLINKEIELEFNDDYYNKFINKSQINYKIDNRIINFFKSNEGLLRSNSTVNFRC